MKNKKKKDRLFLISFVTSILATAFCVIVSNKSSCPKEFKYEKQKDI